MPEEKHCVWRRRWKSLQVWLEHKINEPDLSAHCKAAVLCKVKEEMSEIVRRIKDKKARVAKRDGRPSRKVHLR